MTGEIIRIDKIKKLRNTGDSFMRVHFKLEDGRWAKMDLVPSFRNFMRWKDKLKVGVRFKGLEVKDEITIDADSIPEVCRTQEEELKELSQKGVFG